MQVCWCAELLLACKTSMLAESSIADDVQHGPVCSHTGLGHSLYLAAADSSRHGSDFGVHGGKAHGNAWVNPSNKSTSRLKMVNGEFR